MLTFRSSSPKPVKPNWQPPRHFSDLSFWLCFAILNGLLFMPFFVAGVESAGASSAPLIGETGGGWLGIFGAAARTIGFVHFSAELILLVTVWVLLAEAKRRKPARHWAIRLWAWVLPVLYLFTLLYHTYEAVVRSVYQMEPVFASQYRFIVDGIGFLAEHVDLSWFSYAGAILGGVAGLFGIGLLFRWLGKAVDRGISRASRLGLIALSLMVLVSAGVWGRALAAPDAPISSLGVKLAVNVQASIQTQQQVARLRDASVVNAYDYGDLWLGKRPNIMLIFVESYGSVLYKRPDYALAYTALLDELQSALAADGWHTASALSESPTWGGGSWMAYTSALFGLRIDEHPQYLALLDRFEGQTYPSLGVYLQSQGYNFTWLSTVSKELKDDEWNRYKRFYGVDEWLRYRDLGYDGPRYGWGPAPPDQYALHAVRERLQAQPDPYFLFFITQNSHYPWVPLPQLADWRSLSHPAADPVVGDQDAIDHAVRRQNYMNAVDYELRMLTELILSEPDDETIYILVGDHQPPRVSRNEDGFETPIHIISRNPGFVDQFEQVGFVPGLRVDGTTVELNGDPAKAIQSLLDREPILHHEGLYSLLVRALLAEYGLPPANLAANLPEYLPNGVQLDSLPQPDASKSVSEQPKPVLP